MAFVPNSGAVSTDLISNVFSLGDDFNNYRGTKWYYPGNLMYGFFSSGTLKSSDFYGKQPDDPAGAGVLFSNTAGTGSFVVPLYRNSLTIEIWGAGGGGGGADGKDGSKGGDTSITDYYIGNGAAIAVNYVAGGGLGGEKGTVPQPPPPPPAEGRGGPDYQHEVYYNSDLGTYTDRTVDNSGRTVNEQSYGQDYDSRDTPNDVGERIN